VWIRPPLRSGKGDWKLIKRYEGKTFELFNLKEDIGEKHELAEKMPEKVKELDALLKNWLKETGAKLPIQSAPPQLLRFK